MLVVEGHEALVRQAMRAHGLDGARAVIDRLPLRRRLGGRRLPPRRHRARRRPRAGAARGRPGARPRRPARSSTCPRTCGSGARRTSSSGTPAATPSQTLRRDLEAAGFRPVVLTHVFSWLVLPVWLKRRFASGQEAELGLDQTSPLLDRVAMVLTRLERALIGRASSRSARPCSASPSPSAEHRRAPPPRSGPDRRGVVRRADEDRGRLTEIDHPDQRRLDLLGHLRLERRHEQVVVHVRRRGPATRRPSARGSPSCAGAGTRPAGAALRGSIAATSTTPGLARQMSMSR